MSLLIVWLSSWPGQERSHRAAEQQTAERQAASCIVINHSERVITNVTGHIDQRTNDGY